MPAVAGRFGLERGDVAGSAWFARSAMYLDNLNRQVGSELVGGAITPRSIAPPGCTKVPCPIGDCNTWACGIQISATIDLRKQNTDCAREAIEYPLKSNSPLCGYYSVDRYFYLGAEAGCFCRCAGNSAWSNFVRACLICKYRGGADGWDAHWTCYQLADELTQGRRPNGTLVACYLNCWGTWN